jgi:two-component system nitrogen regulation sensor histidine kinase NtrY
MSFLKSRLKIFFEGLFYWSQRLKLPQKFVVLLLIGAVGAGIATYSAFTSSSLLGENSRKIIHLLNFDLAILLLLGALIARRIIKLWAERRSRRAGSKLHLRLALIFSALTVVPTLFISISSALLFNEGIQAWFNERVRTALNESSAVAKAYFEEHKKTVSTSVNALALRFSENFARYAENVEYFSEELDKECVMMSLNEGIIFGLNHKIYARTRLSLSLEFESLNLLDLQRARDGVILQTSESGDRVRAFTRIPNTDAFIVVGRYLDKGVLKRISNTREAVMQYNQLEALQSDLEIKLAVSFIIVSLILLLAAIWMGLLFADHMARPISELIFAAESVRKGDYSIKVSEKISEDEISILSRAFNRMTTEIRKHKKELLEANEQIDQRRQFIEVVLGGVTAGVIELSIEGNIRLLNRSAVDLLSLGDESTIIGKKIADIIPEMVEYLARAFEDENRFHQAELSLTRHGFTKTLLVRVVVEYNDKVLRGFIITFDDITALIAAQRKAAWSDVARRIAHEIKNPLTPIQLSAERLRRKYLKEIEEDRENFEKYIEVIVRQVSQIERLVSEFSSFARMPSAKMAPENLVELCQQALYLQKSAYPDIEFGIKYPHNSLKILCDASQMGQLFTNLLQNAIDSIKGLRDKNKGGLLSKGQVFIILTQHSKYLEIRVEDNGEGFPEEKAYLLDPYVTLREKGTGLGLAIVKKIVEDHSGELSLENRQEGGASVRMSFPLSIIVPTDEEVLPFDSKHSEGILKEI